MTNISESFYLQDGDKNQQMEMEQNYVTVTQCMTTRPMTTRRCSLLGFLPARRYATASLYSYGPVSVCLSVTSRCSIEMDGRIELVFGM